MTVVQLKALCVLSQASGPLTSEAAVPGHTRKAAAAILRGMMARGWVQSIDNYEKPCTWRILPKGCAALERA